MNTLTTRVTELAENGLSIAKIRATLTLADHSAKDISAAIKASNVGKTKVGFASEFYLFISAEKRTINQATGFVMGTGKNKDTSGNVQKHLSHYLAIHALSVTIWNNK